MYLSHLHAFVATLNRPLSLFLALMLVVSMLWAIPPRVARAATFTVNSTVDAVDANPGDGVCATATGECTLRAAIMEANALPGDDTITLPAGTYTLSIAGAGEDAGATGDLDISSNLTITGADASTTVIEAEGIDRVLNVIGSIPVNISGVSISGGNSGLFSGGGILNRFGILTLTNSAIVSNTAQGGAGGIFNSAGVLTLTNSTVSGNTALVNGGGIVNSDGSTLTLTNSTVISNTASDGGGIYNNVATLTATNSTVSGNTGGINGGGILNIGTLTIINSTFSRNSARSTGAIGSSGTLDITNSTFSDNSASYFGGGISNAGLLNVTNSTFSGNSGGVGGIFNDGTATLRNTIVANSLSGGNCSGTITDGGGNLSWPDTTCPGLNADPLLGLLANNGGPTETHALLPGSAAVDNAVDANCPATDQRGVARPQGAACDIGAFELEAPTVIEVVIDIKPGSDPNSIKRNSRGTIPVAILSTADFDAPSQVDKTSLTFGRTGDEESLAFCTRSAEDVNGDGLLDQVCHFKTRNTGFQQGDTEGILKGMTVDGVSIEGRDSVRIVR